MEYRTQQTGWLTELVYSSRKHSPGAPCVPGTEPDQRIGRWTTQIRPRDACLFSFALLTPCVPLGIPCLLTPENPLWIHSSPCAKRLHYTKLSLTAGPMIMAAPLGSHGVYVESSCLVRYTLETKLLFSVKLEAPKTRTPFKRLFRPFPSLA